jgi:hypothetical protein
MSMYHHRRKYTRAMWLRLWARPRAEKWLVLEALVLCLLSAVALRLLGFKRWKWILRGSSRGAKFAERSFSGGDVTMAEATYAIVDMVARNMPRGWVTCLPRSLTLWWLLRQRGIASQLRIGVRKDGERVVAHAWVVCHDMVVGENEHKQFEPFESATLAT